MVDTKKTGPGYHLTPIQKGVFGKLSKIEEELFELKDALDQGCRIMAQVELADMFGALLAYADKEFGLSMRDLEVMSHITQRAFTNGHR